MKKKHTKTQLNLKLNRETILSLEDSKVLHAAGGGGGSSNLVKCFCQ